MTKKKMDTEKEQKLIKLLKILIYVLGAFIILILLVFIGAQMYFMVPVIDYYKDSERAFTIPGLSNDMVPQGLDYIEEDGIFLIGGYQKDGSPSRVYRAKKDNGKSDGYVVLGDEDGTPIAPHAGGLAAHGDYLFVAGDEDPFVYVFDLPEVLSSAEGTVVKSLGKFETTFRGDSIRADFMCFTEDRFIVGEFYRDPNYLTPDSHNVETPSGEVNRALALCYPFSDEKGAAFGISRRPAEAYSLPDLVQGIAVHDGKVWISQSYGTAKSTISCYDVSDSEPAAIFLLHIYSGVDLPDEYMPVYALDSSTRVASFEAPPMAEEIIFVDGRLLIMCESASNKYYFGKLTGGKWCYSTDVSELF